MKAIVTGASGFVGRAVCKELAERGHKVTAVVRDKSKAVDATNIVACDMENYSLLSDIIKEHGFDVMYHFAWQGTAGGARKDHLLQLKNVEASCVLAEQCVNLECKKIIYAGSIMEHEAAALMETENEPSGAAIYSTAKLTADYMMRTVASMNEIGYIKTIISNIYGPGDNAARLINSSLRKMLKGERCSFTSGEQMYDFIYIDDAAKAFAALGEKGKCNKRYYIGSRKPKKLKCFLTEMRDTVAPDIELGLGEIPFNGISLDYNRFDIDAVFDDTGFEPRITFAEGIKRTAESIKEGK